MTLQLARRAFLAAAGVAPVSTLPGADSLRPITQASVSNDPAAPREQVGAVPASSPFDEPLTFARKDFRLRVKPIAARPFLERAGSQSRAPAPL
jgi:hypothetical protein